MSNQVSVSHRNAPRAPRWDHSDSQGIHSGAGLLQQTDSNARAEGDSSSGSARCHHVSEGAILPSSPIRPGPEIPISTKSFLHPRVGGGRQISLQAMLNLCSLHSEVLLLPPSPCAPEGKSSSRWWSHASYEQNIWSRNPLYQQPYLLGWRLGDDPSVKAARLQPKTLKIMSVTP